MNPRIQSFDTVAQSGTYECMNCFSAEHTFVTGQQAPLCDNCRRHVTWELKRAKQDGPERKEWPVID